MIALNSKSTGPRNVLKLLPVPVADPRFSYVADVEVVGLLQRQRFRDTGSFFGSVFVDLQRVARRQFVDLGHLLFRFIVPAAGGVVVVVVVRLGLLGLFDGHGLGGWSSNPRFKQHEHGIQDAATRLVLNNQLRNFNSRLWVLG